MKIYAYVTNTPANSANSPSISELPTKDEKKEQHETRSEQNLSPI